MEVHIKKIKFPSDLDSNGVSFTKATDTINIDSKGHSMQILEKLRELWAQSFPEMVSTIENPKNLKLMHSGKIIGWDTSLSNFKIKAGDSFILVSKVTLAAGESKPKSPEKQVDMHVDAKKSDVVVPILDRVTEDDVDKNALNQLLMLGYDKDISVLALSKVGTEYGSLGYDGLNKAMDWIQRKLSSSLQDHDKEKMIVKQKEEQRKVDLQEMKKRLSLEARDRYDQFQKKVDKHDSSIKFD